jgi:hypothetical protein
VSTPDPALDQALRAELDTCRRELAQVREQQEPLAEQRGQERRKRVRAEKRLAQLSVAVDAKLRELDSADAGRGRSRGRGLRAPREGRLALEQDIALLEDSRLFRGPWYVRQYPEVVATGMSPARHYLEIGAGKGYDPGPRFSSTEYLEAHPEAARSGTNPLLHHLRASLQSRADGSAPDSRS